jgi:hypothetical protein
MNGKYSLIENLYSNLKNPPEPKEIRYSLVEHLLTEELKAKKAGIDAQKKVGTWVLQKLNSSQAGQFWGHYVDGGNFPDVRIYDSSQPHPKNPDWHKCVLQIEVKDGTSMGNITLIQGEADPKATGIHGWLEAKKSMYTTKYTNPDDGTESNMWFGNMMAGSVESELSKARKNDNGPFDKKGKPIKSDTSTRGTLVASDSTFESKMNSLLRDAIDWVRKNHTNEQGYTMIHGHNDAPWDPKTDTYTLDFKWVSGPSSQSKWPKIAKGVWKGKDKLKTLRRQQSTYGPEKEQWKMKGKNFLLDTFGEKVPDDPTQGHGYPLCAIMVVGNPKGKIPIEAKWFDYPPEEQRKDYLADNLAFGKTGKSGHLKPKKGSTKILKRKSRGSYTPGEGEMFDTMMHRHLAHENETHYAVVKGNSFYIASVGSDSDPVLGVGKAIFDDTPMIKPDGKTREFIDDRNVTRENFFFTMSGGESDTLPSAPSPDMFGYSGGEGKIQAGLGGHHVGYGERPVTDSINPEGE